VEELNISIESFTSTPAMNIAVSHAVLQEVARGEMGPTFRLHIPDAVLAFGMADRIQPGYGHATRIAAAHGFAPVERLAGGRAAVFHEKTLAFSWATPTDDPHSGIAERFSSISGLINSAFRKLGLDSRVGEVPGEYCPGEYSINVGGTTKVMGVGQRLVRGAAHAGGVIVVDGALRIREVLIPTYRALAIDWDPRTTGALVDRAPGLEMSSVIEAIIEQLEQRYSLHSVELPVSILSRATELAAAHLPKVA
jgi:octanoyl-[GcvH]:protein N-octanoyltransferase